MIEIRILEDAQNTTPHMRIQTHSCIQSYPTRVPQGVTINWSIAGFVFSLFLSSWQFSQLVFTASVDSLFVEWGIFCIGHKILYLFHKPNGHMSCQSSANGRFKFGSSDTSGWWPNQTWFLANAAMICSICGTCCSTTMHNYNYYRFLDSKHSKLVWLPYTKHQANACTYHSHSSDITFLLLILTFSTFRSSFVNVLSIV